MNFYFRNPISLLTYRALHDQISLKATYVNAPQTRHGLAITDHDLKIQNKHFEISKFISSKLNISLFQEEFNELSKKKNIFTESSLHQNWRTGDNILLWASSEYCYFGFQNYLKFPLTKLKLKHQWQPINLKKQSLIYLYNQENLRIKSKNTSIIDLQKIRSLLKYITNLYTPKLLKESAMNPRVDTLLFLSHYTDNIESKFFKSYISKATKIAKQHGLKILIKRHKYDIQDYSSLFDTKMLTRSNQDIINFIPVELFFNLNNIKKIIAVPSSSLPFADQSKVDVFVPKTNSEFRREFLHLEPFLNFIGYKYERI